MATRPRPVGLPRWVFVPATAGAAFVVLPLVAILTRVQWDDFFGLITSDSSTAALALSLRTSSISTLLCVVFGVPMAMVLARTTFPGQQLLRSLVLLPLVLPPVVGGIALLYTFGRHGLLGHTFEVLGIQIAFSTTAVVMAQTFVAMPFLVVSLEGALRTSGQRFEAVAATLGARPTTVETTHSVGEIPDAERASWSSSECADLPMPALRQHADVLTVDDESVIGAGSHVEKQAL